MAPKNQLATNKVARAAGPSNLQDNNKIDSKVALAIA